MPHGTVEEFLQVVTLSKRVQFVEILSHHWHKPGDGTLNKTSRKRGTRRDPVLTPYDRVLHVLRQTALLGVDYEKMVNAQRNREAARALEKALADLPSFVKLTPEVEPFTAEAMWNGNGEPDHQFPKLAIRHKKYDQRYIKFWPASDAETGEPIPTESHYFDEHGNELDFMADLDEFWKLTRGDSKVQGTKKKISWSVIKFYNIVRIKAMKMEWTFDGPDRRPPAIVHDLAEAIF